MRNARLMVKTQDMWAKDLRLIAGEYKTKKYDHYISMHELDMCKL